MPGQVRHRWISVTTEAWPLTSERAFALKLTSLSEVAPGILSRDTEQLARELDEWLRPRAAGLSLETLRQFRNSGWFPDPAGYAPRVLRLDEHLNRVARCYLGWRGDCVCLNLGADGDLAERARRFRWLSLMLPADLLAAALAAHHGATLTTSLVNLATPQLARVLEQPVANTHYHVGASLSFEELWSDLMRRIAYENPAEQPDTGPSPFGSWRRFGRRLVQAAVARVLLGHYLRARELGRTHDLLEKYLPRTMPELLRGRVARSSERRLLETVRRAIVALEHGSSDIRWELPLLRLWYSRLLGKNPGRPRTLEDVNRHDPLRLALGSRGDWCETTLVVRALGRIRASYGEGRPDKTLETLFWQYERVRVATFRYLTQEPGTAGLDWFYKHYSRIRALRGDLGSHSFESALAMDSRGARLAATEPRTMPDKHWYEVRDYARQLIVPAQRFAARGTANPPEFGLVFHFVKERTRRARDGRRTKSDPGVRQHADPSNRVYRCRYGTWYAENEVRAQAMETALLRHPELLVLIRGLDIASIEHFVPGWPVFSLVNRTRGASRWAAQALARRLPSWHAAPLRVTLHAGEDFRRLSEGLRRLHEPIEFGVLHAGDRIGHGLALGTDPRDWSDAAPLAAQPREERLDDLLWEITRYRKGQLPVDAGRIELVRAEIQEQANKIYGDPTPPVEVLLRARRRLHDGACLRALGYPRMQPPRNLQNTDVQGLLNRYLVDRDVFARGQEAIHVPVVDSELRMLEAAQCFIRREFGRLEITVEANPSSNLVIADLPNLESHPLFRLMPLRESLDDPSVPVSINVDNAITFATDIADEYAHTYYAMLRAGISADRSLAWLERARRAGWRSRFTVRTSTDDVALRRIHDAWRATRGGARVG